MGHSSLYPHWDWMALDHEAWEGQGMTSESLAGFLDAFISPLLLVGAGAGSVQTFLKEVGFDTIGIDQSVCMCMASRRARGQNSICAVGHRLPFREHQFHTVIIPTGVLDIDQHAQREQILLEAKRVLSVEGKLLICIYAPPADMVEMGCETGLMRGLSFDQRRIFSLWQAQGDLSQWTECVTRWRDLPYSQAGAIVAKYHDILAQISDGLDAIARRSRMLALDPEEYLSHCLAFSLNGWPIDRYESYLQALNMRVVQQKYEPWAPALMLLVERAGAELQGHSGL